MKVCDVVLDSVWYDPRVRKQIISYKNNGIDICVVGAMDARYDKQKVAEIPCKVVLTDIPEEYKGGQKRLSRKLKRERIRNDIICNAIVEQKPDIIHANDLNVLEASYKAAQKLKCKLIFDSHEICTENAGKKKAHWKLVLKRKIWKIIFKHKEKKLVKKVDLMVCVSNAAAEYFEQKYKIKKPMVVTNCTLKSESVNYDSVIKNEGFEVLNHGQFYEGRGYDIMVDTCELLKDVPNVRLAIRGFGKMEQALREKVSKLQNKEQFIFYPPVHVSDLIKSASSSMVGVAITEPICLNFKLSVSNKLFEYVSAGLPVIMSDIPEHRYLNEKYKFGMIIKDNNSECLAGAVKKLYLDKKFYNNCAENAKKMAEEINWENEFARLLKKESEILNN